MVDSGVGGVTGISLAGGSPFSTFATNAGINGLFNLPLEYSTAKGSPLMGLVAAVDDTVAPIGAPDGICQAGEQCGIGAFYYAGQVVMSIQDTTAGGSAYASGGVVDVMKLDIFASTGTIANALLFGDINFTGVDPVAHNMFYLADGTNLWNLWNNGIVTSMPVNITGRVDANVDPRVALTTCTGAEAISCDYVRTNSLDGSFRIDVPEPTTLALMGAGLMVLGFRRRARSI